jgi:hypothetical protein
MDFLLSLLSLLLLFTGLVLVLVESLLSLYHLANILYYEIRNRV